MYKTRIWMEQATTHHSFRPSEAAARALASGMLQHSSITDASGQTVMVSAEAEASRRRAMSQPSNHRPHMQQQMDMNMMHHQNQHQNQHQHQNQSQHQNQHQGQHQGQHYGMGAADSRMMSFNQSYPPRGPPPQHLSNQQQQHVAYGFSPHRDSRPSGNAMYSPHAAPMEQQMGMGFNNMLGLGLENHDEGSYLDSRH
jgi:hypothetical protein